MTIDEAIAHCLEVAEQNEIQANKIGRQFIGSAKDKCATDCRECAAEHRQLAEWLMEYKDLKSEQNDQYVFIHEIVSKLKEAKGIISVCNRVLGYLLECEIENTSTRHEVETLLKNITEYLSGGSENE